MQQKKNQKKAVLIKNINVLEIQGNQILENE